MEDPTTAPSGGSGAMPERGAAVLSRRRFLQAVGTSGAGAATVTITSEATAQATATVTAPPPAAAATGYPVTLKVNGTSHRLTVQANAVLLDTLRDQLHLTGTKKGCDHGQCGACTLIVNGVTVNSCLSVTVMHDGDEITTVEGLSHDGQLHPVQQAFWDHDAYQCGYCTAGQVMSAIGILQDKRVPADEAAVREAMSGNICRCGAYKNIVAAIQDARGKIGRS
ncbi:(2Fe-2S)-binding protein [Cupriavidus pauculus]|uniref:(2Fe-2S)-binding protein n=1 Tax=Cupriavidus pauculus TaxID=82633 RepID=UPI001EE2B9A3|nr:(2Fe-2S)-binding protein [Cupriavidus pauculus]GJG94730.1 (2Fe-2S)-binding protein [Cupriavidus pauculus]